MAKVYGFPEFKQYKKVLLSEVDVLTQVLIDLENSKKYPEFREKLIEASIKSLRNLIKLKGDEDHEEFR